MFYSKKEGLLGKCDTKKGCRCSPNLDNLKSNTMKNTSQRYAFFQFALYEKWKICIFTLLFYIF